MELAARLFEAHEAGDFTHFLGDVELREDLIIRLHSCVEGFEDVFGFCAIADSAIPWAALLSWDPPLPIVYVRRKPKSYGLKKLVEGKVVEGKKYVIVCEDACDAEVIRLQMRALQDVGASVAGVLALYSEIDDLDGSPVISV